MGNTQGNVNNSSLLRQRIVILSGEVTEESATQNIAELLFLSREDSQARIQLYIKPFFGPIYLLKAIHGAIKEISAPVSTIAFEYTTSFSTVILTEGENGMRYALPGTRIQLYQTQELPEILREELITTYMRHANKDYSTIEHDLDQNLVFTPQQAIDYGLIDGILNL